MTTNFNLNRLLHDVFAPDARDKALVMVDVPRNPADDFPDWKERRAMAEEWRQGLIALGIPTQPLLTYPATGANNGDLPAHGVMDDRPVELAEVLRASTLVIAMTRYSATAPLSILTREAPNLRAASMPNVLRRMEQSALAADYTVVARKASTLATWLGEAESAEVEFATGHTFRFDLRHRSPHADDGMCRRDKQGFRVINLPSGEAFMVPYEGERAGDASRTGGQIPLPYKGHTYVLEVKENRIGTITGHGPDRTWLEEHFAIDPARRNIAELGLGCNDQAIITGNVLEDEKAGFHWAYGRSEHLGGVVGPDAFSRPENVIHHDVVYAKGCPIEIAKLDLIDAAGHARAVIRSGSYVPGL